MNIHRLKHTQSSARRFPVLPVALILSLTLVFSMTVAPAFAVTAQVFDKVSVNQGTQKKAAGNDKVVVEDVDYDRGDREVEFEFRGSVKWKNPKVKITRNGKNYARYIKKKDSDEIEVVVKKLKYGATYKYRITGVKNRSGSKYQTVTGKFRAIDD